MWPQASRGCTARSRDPTAASRCFHRCHRLAPPLSTASKRLLAEQLRGPAGEQRASPANGPQRDRKNEKGTLQPVPFCCYWCCKRRDGTGQRRLLERTFCWSNPIGCQRIHERNARAMSICSFVHVRTCVCVFLSVLTYAWLIYCCIGAYMYAHSNKHSQQHWYSRKKPLFLEIMLRQNWMNIIENKPTDIDDYRWVQPKERRLFPLATAWLTRSIGKLQRATAAASCWQSARVLASLCLRKLSLRTGSFRTGSTTVTWGEEAPHSMIDVGESQSWAVTLGSRHGVRHRTDFPILAFHNKATHTAPGDAFERGGASFKKMNFSLTPIRCLSTWSFGILEQVTLHRANAIYIVHVKTRKHAGSGLGEPIKQEGGTKGGEGLSFLLSFLSGEPPT